MQLIKLNKKIKQVGFLYTSMIIGIFLGIIVSVLNTRLLGPESFGDYKFVQSVYSFLSITLGFGFFVTISKLLAEKKNDSIRKELIGSSIVIFSIIGIIFMISIYFFAITHKIYFTNDLSRVFLILLPMFFIIPFMQGLENIYQGENRIYELSIYRFAPQLLYIIAIFFVYKFSKVSLLAALGLHLGTIAIVNILFIYFLKPSFKSLSKTIRIILIENKKFGINVYVGSIIGVATSQFGPIIISYFSNNNVDVGFYTLAITITMPLSFIPTVVGTSMFKDFANRDGVSLKATKVTIIISIFTLVVFMIIVKPVVILLYSEKYIEVVNLAYFVAVGQLLHGFGNYYNRFLGSKGQGKSLRNGAISVGITNLVGYVVLISYYGAMGAAITRLFSGFVFITSMLYYYRKFRKNNCKLT